MQQIFYKYRQLKESFIGGKKGYPCVSRVVSPVFRAHLAALLYYVQVMFRESPG